MSWAVCVSAACLCVCPLLVVVICDFFLCVIFLLSLCSAFGSTPVNLNIKAAGRTHASVGPKAKGVDLDALGSVNGIPVLEVDIESFEEKPWRKPGSDLSDYFNYGFNEDTWKTYCEKQRRLRMGYEGMSHASATKIMVHQGRSAHGDRDGALSCFRYQLYYVFCMFTLCSALVSRKPSGTIDVIGGQTGTISRVEGRRRHNIEGNNIQVLSEPPSDAEPTPTKMPPFFPPNIPPPPFPPPPHNVSSAPPLIPPPRVYPPPPPGSAAASWAGVFDSAKAWEYYAQRDNERERHKERDRTRERGHEKEREREREHNPSSQVVNSEEDRHRHRDYGERGYDRHHHERSSREKEERHREKRHRDKEEGRHKSSSSSSRRRHESEEGDSHRRHKHKKVKRSREDKEPSQELSADQENQSEPTE
uniref:FIP1 like 1a (S. cerevisiae) n=1 Tax=Oncorhynchus mykiss TaxID=8022 RepID=A0A8C7NFA4_ONCMY